MINYLFQMPSDPYKLSQFWQELKRRKVVRIITVYAAAAFVILELVDIVSPSLRLPDWTLNFIIVLLCVGFIITIIFSWIYDVTPDGIEKTKPVHKYKKDDPQVTSNSWKVASYISFVVIVALIVLHLIPRSNRSWDSTNLETSIAVLPFDNMSVGEEYSHLGDAITDEIILELQKAKAYDRILSRSSTMQYKDSRPTIPEMAEKLGVNYIIEGSIQRHNEKVSIRVQVIRAMNEDHIWGEEYNGKWDDIFTFQDEIALAVADELKTILSPEEIEQIDKRPTANPEAYNMYLKGRYFWHQRKEEDLKRSIKYFNQAIELDSGYALAYAGLADSYFIMAWWGWHPLNEGYSRGREFAQKALLINDNIAEAYATLGGIATWYDRRWKEAEKELIKSISLNPNYATAHQWYAELLEILGENKEARDQIDIALQLSPNTYQINSISCLIYYSNSEYRKAIEASQKVLEIEYRLSPMLRIFKCYLHLGMDEEALEQMKKILSIEAPGIDSELIDEMYQQSGMEGVIVWFIDKIILLDLTKNYRIASLYAIIKDSEKAIAHLEKGFERGVSNMPRINNNPDFSFLRTDPRFIKMLKEMNL